MPQALSCERKWRNLSERGKWSDGVIKQKPSEGQEAAALSFSTAPERSFPSLPAKKLPSGALLQPEARCRIHRGGSGSRAALSQVGCAALVQHGSHSSSVNTAGTRMPATAAPAHEAREN